MNLLIAVPCMDFMQTKFVQSLVQMEKTAGCMISFAVGSLVYRARNLLAQQAIDCGAEYVLWLDSDMVFEPDTLTRLLADIEGRDIVTALYFRRVAPYTPVLMERLEIKDGQCINEHLKTYPSEIFEVDGCGFGCVLMRTEVLKAILEKDGPMWFAPMGNVGEDFAFCIRARRHGYNVYCDPTLKLGHVGSIVVTEEFYGDRPSG